MVTIDMGALHKSAASIGFYGDDLDPAEITALLGSPTVAVKMGDANDTPGGRTKIGRTGSWRLKAEDQQPGDLDQQINDLLDRLSNDLASWRELTGRFHSRVFCGLFLGKTNEGLGLKPETLTRLGERGLRLDLDIYGTPVSE